MEELYKIAPVLPVVAVFKALSVHLELFFLIVLLICTIWKHAELDVTHSWAAENSLV